MTQSLFGRAALRRALPLSAMTLVSLMAAMSAQAQEAQDAKAKTEGSDETPQVIVTAPPMIQPMVIETDPRNPRTPVPPSDGAGYLKNIPGFTVVRQGAVDGDPLLRGQGGSRLNILLDGAPLLGGCPNRMDPPTSYIFPDSFDKLTVLKGPQSVVHGGAALGTVLVEREPPRFSKFTTRVNASALYGSHDRNDEMIDVQMGDKPGFARAIATHSSSDNYRDGHGDLLHSNYWRNSGSAQVGWTPNSDTLLQLGFDMSQGQAAMPGKSMDATQLDREGVNLQFSKTNISPLLTGVKAQLFHNYVDHIMDVYSLRSSINNMNMGASQVDHLMNGGKISADLALSKATSLTVGMDYSHDEHTSRSQSYTEYLSGISLDSKMRVRDITFDTYSTFAEAKHQLDTDKRLTGGYRFSRVEAARNSVQPNWETNNNLHSGFGRYEQDMTLSGLPVTTFASLGHVERTADYWERTRITTSNRTFNLEPEQTEQLDVGVLFSKGPWRGSASAFYAYSDNYILIGGNSTSTSNAKNVEAVRWGGEGEVAYNFLPNWTVEATLAYVHGENLSDNVPLAQTPPLDGSLAVKYDDGQFLGALHLRAVAGQHRIHQGWGNIMGTDLGESGGFAVLSANGGWRYDKAITLTAGIDNILDKAYAEHVSRNGIVTTADLAAYSDNIRVNEPGRTFWMRASMKF